MSSLFELNDQFRELSQRDDLDPTVMKDTLDAIEDSRDQKLDNIASWIDNNNADLDWLTKRIKELQEKKKFLTNQNHNLMTYLTDAIDDAGFKKIRTENHLLSVRNFKASTVIDDVKKLPEAFVETKTVSSPDKTAIYKAIKAGQEVPGAYLKNNRRTVIR